MAKTVSRTIKDIVVADVSSVTITGPLDDPTKLVISAISTLRDDGTGEAIDILGFEVEDLPAGKATALSAILTTDVVAAANAAVAARADTEVKILPE